jgi:hypothetical protein
MEKAEKELVKIAKIDYMHEFNQKFEDLLYDEETFEYPFNRLVDKGIISFSESKDKRVRIYEWHDGTGNYNGGFHHIIQYKSNDGKLLCIDFMEAYCPECKGEEYYDEFRGFDLYTMQLNNKTYYLIEVGHLKAAGWLGYRDISIYTIEGANLVKQTLFKTSKELLAEIGYEYDAANYWNEIASKREEIEKDVVDWHFRYDDEQKTIYVPLVDNDLSYGRVTDRFLLYQWDGKYFAYKGTSGAYWLHPSLSKYKRKVHEFDTQKFHVRIDDMGSNKYRYASWAKKKSTTEKPDLVIENGNYNEEIGGSSVRYIFKNGEYIYTYSEIYGKNIDGEKYLIVEKNDKEILREEIKE